ncbi:IS30 family transposase [Lacicoccus qingdaonensis]|uniref:Transposase and inactivated derivatives, IS30 family n=1 Tax=Lacicoccus qingdaonensis TaxID=576118 RepID=A0A1G9ITN8_9BACL|nr:IS30 family transposase [Salinicoccus qingdaonensis]SDL28293.1 Transposase and inactivated derivatives, IS30 family [Salinicoccus qingdaonensis]
MTQLHDTTESIKGKHLTKAERAQIEILKQENYSNRDIAARLGRAPQTINNEIKRGTVRQIRRQKQNGKTYDYEYYVYDPGYAQTRYDTHRLHSGRRPKWSRSNTFVDWADTQMLDHHWSPDAVVGAAKQRDMFPAELMPCTTTLYNWIDRHIMRTKNINLSEKPSRNTKSKTRQDREHQRDLGPSIAERPETVESRETFGHWEIDTVIGSKHKDDAVLLTLAERQTRFEVLLKIDGKAAQPVTEAIESLVERAGDHMPSLFKPITSDNGSEFSALHDTLKAVTDVYFARPFASYERGTSENQHKLIRRFIPKGQSISAVSDRQIQRIQRWMNDYPRKILGYRTPHEHFAKALNQTQMAHSA